MRELFTKEINTVNGGNLCCNSTVPNSKFVSALGLIAGPASSIVCRYSNNTQNYKIAALISPATDKYWVDCSTQTRPYITTCSCYNYPCCGQSL